jgi:hypothetical protein
VIVRVEALADRDREALVEDEIARLERAVQQALPGRRVRFVVAQANGRELDFGALANLQAEVVRDGGSLEDGMRVAVVASRRGHSHTRAAEFNALVALVAAEHGLEPKTVLGTSKAPAAARARRRLWWLAHERGMTDEAVAAACDVTHQAVTKGRAVVEAEMAENAETRALMTWAASAWRRSAS